jgi:hypothetical protein
VGAADCDRGVCGAGVAFTAFWIEAAEKSLKQWQAEPCRQQVGWHWHTVLAGYRKCRDVN